MNQYWLFVNWRLKSTLQWNSNRYTKFFIHKNAFENVCEITAILSRGRWIIFTRALRTEQDAGICILFIDICLLFFYVVVVCNYNMMALYIDDLVQDCSNSCALALELQQPCAKPSISLLHKNRDRLRETRHIIKNLLVVLQMSDTLTCVRTLAHFNNIIYIQIECWW